MLDIGGAIIRDTSAFGATSPVLGQRFRVDLTPSFGDLRMVNVTVDFRQYFMPVRPVTLAVRALHVGRYGATAEDTRLTPLFIGYSTLVRGYEIGSFDVNECEPGPAGECQAFDQIVGSRVLVGNAEAAQVPRWAAFGGDNFYGPLPVELAAFADIGVAWDSRSRPRFAGGNREPVRSVGVAILRERLRVSGRGDRRRAAARSPGSRMALAVHAAARVLNAPSHRTQKLA